MTSPVPASEKAKRELETVRHMQKMLARSGYIITCMNCENWSDGKLPVDKGFVGCRRYEAMPPPEVIAFGCPDWDQLIPF